MNISPHRRPTVSKVSAFTLTEVIIAVLLIGIMGFSLYGSFFLGFQTVDADRQDLRATQILMQKAEAIRLCTWSQLNNFTFQEVYDPSGQTNGTGGTLFTGSVATNSPDNISDTAAYKANMRLVTITVYWTNFNGKSSVIHSRQMQTQVARYGLQNYIWGTVN